ncbi:MAG: sugar phosphate nucleotidyltransferase [Elusimicrobiota bacterium]|nr:MAG: sugar phosphate nucleotidyltransferase [Elusimicrobiota bacterium]
MKALILAAGVGSRLKPLTDSTPKALIPVGGVPMLERNLIRLKAAGVKSFVVNAHAHPQQVADFCAAAAKRLAVPISVSREDTLLLDTGGAIKKAAMLLKGRDPFFVHNADVLTDLDLKALMAFHKESGALATLSVRERESGRAFLFDAKGRLAGHDRGEGAKTWAKGPVPNPQRLPFDGIHAISPELLDKITETGVFSITKTYVRLAAAGADIRAFRGDAWAWHDIGDAEKLAKAEAWAAANPA